MIISIDGIDGIGKTTISKELAKRLDFTIIKGVKDPYVDKLAYSSNYIEVRYLYYLATFIDAHLDALGSNKSVILDRSFYSTIAYHQVFGSGLDLSFIAEKIPRPDLSFFLTSKNQHWLEELQSRQDLDWYETKLILDPSKKDEIESWYMKLGLRELENNNQHSTIENIITYIINENGTT